MSVEPITYDVIINDYFKSQLATVRVDGSVVGHKKFEGQQYGYQKWHFIPNGEGGFALLNEATKIYLGGYGHLLVPTHEEYFWKIVPKSGPLPGYYIETRDGERTWFLPSGADGTQIELKPVKEIHGTVDVEKAEWVYKKA